MSTAVQMKRARPARKYLYAVIAGVPEQSFGAVGINEAEVYSITRGGLAAVVSDVCNGALRPERRHLSVHQQVLRRLLELTTPLPVSFGTIANGAGAVRQILSEHEDALTAGLHRVAGKVEMGLRVRWDVPNIFEYFIDTHPELKTLRDRILGGARVPSQEEKIEVGRFFDRLLEADREEYTAQVEDVLSPQCFEINRGKCRDEREIMNLACLVGKPARAGFETAVFEAARLFNDSFAFDFNGPWAPHNFADVDLHQ